MSYVNPNPLTSNSIILPDIETDYIKLRQHPKTACLYTLLPPRKAGSSKEMEEPARPEKRKRGRPRKQVVPPTIEEVKEPELIRKGLRKGTFKIENGRDYIYIEDYEELTAHSKGGYRLNTYRLLDFLLWQLGEANCDRMSDSGKYVLPLCTQLTLPMEQYIRCCGYAAEITDSKRKDTQKELQKDLRLLCATLIGFNTDNAVRLLDAGCVRNGQITVTFSDRMADLQLIQGKSMWYPVKLMHLGGKYLMSYSLGRNMAMHSCITGNQLQGTDWIFSVKEILKYCCGLPSPAEVRRRNGNYQQIIFRPFKKALDRLKEMKILSWNYRWAKEKGPESYDDFFRDTVEYFMNGIPEGLQELD